ncbi:peptidase [Flavobacterium algicola]|uniref:peptidase n=1 Tax=Flavobacterium algicola TaxID=556529 RepID=UPI001EFD1B88|nr:peptidase [Flavobacterium algicola]MCG9791799.1 peptidase [Flavobacterium algicola]
MSEKRLKRKKLKNKLFTKNRLVILNEESFEEIFSLKLNLMNVFVVATLGAILLISITTFIIAFTPLREYIPGYSSSQLKSDATKLALKSDSLTKALKKNEVYIQSIQKVLNGQLEYAKFNKDSILNNDEEPEPQLDLNPSKEELELRKSIAEEEKKAAQLSKTKEKSTKK